MQKEPNLTPLYMLLFLAMAICSYAFFLGATAARLWFYEGALGPHEHRATCRRG